MENTQVQIFLHYIHFHCEEEPNNAKININTNQIGSKKIQKQAQVQQEEMASITRQSQC